MAESETGWLKEFPKVEGVYWARRTQTNRPEPTVVQVWQDGGEWFAYRFNDNRDIEAQRFTESLYEFLGPLSPSDAEQLTELRRLAIEARDVLALLVPYGKIHTVEGVRYPDGSHSEAVDRGERVLNQIRDIVGTDDQ